MQKIYVKPKDYLVELRRTYPDIEIAYYQSNVEGEMINKIHEVGFDYDGIVRIGIIVILPFLPFCLPALS